MITEVRLTTTARRQLRKLPTHIVKRLLFWVSEVEHSGLEHARKTPGWHDEPLKGKRRGQRSIRLSRAYRAIYTIQNDVIEFASVEEVHKHDY